MRIKIQKNKAKAFAMMVRIPGWVRGEVVPGSLYRYCDKAETGYTVSVNGKKVDGALTDGYVRIEREWKKGDVVDIHFDMEPRLVEANAKVEADRGRVAVERGPLVYCAEQPDNSFNVFHFMLGKHPELAVKDVASFAGNIKEITAGGTSLAYDGSGKVAATPARITLIPYYAWCHRGAARMAVWLNSGLESIEGM